MSEMLKAAMWYLNLGWSIIPQLPGAKKPLVKWLQYQYQRATQAQIERWWTRWPNAGICLILGPVSRIVAVDSDSVEAQNSLLKLLDGEPITAKSLSGSRASGKVHYFFISPSFPTGAKYTPLHPQLELRGHGGYVVLPPSLHGSGNRYAWAEPQLPVAALPEPLAAVWRANPRFTGTVTRSAGCHHASDQPQQSIPSTSPELLSVLNVPGLAASTQRWLLGHHAHRPRWNSRLFAAACDLAGLVVPFDVAAPLLLIGAQPDTPADHQQARQTIRSAYSQPRVPLRQYSATAQQRQPLVPTNDHGSVRIFASSQLRRCVKVEE